MPKINRAKISKILIFALCLAVVIAVPIMAVLQKHKAKADEQMTVLSLWQIDSFEGGRGSRASYLQNIADEFSKKTGCYVIVTAVSSESARYNLKNGAQPDLISYGAGIYGIENYIKGKTPYYTWCNGGYCFLTLDTSANFEDITPENVVINGGVENYVDVVALLCGVNGAVKEKPTGAYVSLINGKYKYLLGTQRDIFRLKTRGVEFSVKPITQFNDLYQNISITCDGKKATIAQQYIKFLLENSDKIAKLGLMSDGKLLYDDEMRLMEGLTYETRLTSPISENTKNEINSAIINCDIKKLKNLLN